MNINEKIDFYKEILEQDPQSKLFFPLAKLYIEKKDIENAIMVLKKGIEIHPDHIEARLMLIELLRENGEMDNMEPHLEKLENLFNQYPMFWRYWATYLAKKGNKDLAGFISLIGAYFQIKDSNHTIGEKIYDIIENTLGINYTSRTQTEVQEPITVEQSSEQEAEVPKASFDELDTQDVEFKTKTMADILMSQGDFKKAIEIYEELLKKEKDPGVREEIEVKLKEAKAKLNSKKPEKHKKSPSFSIKQRLIKRLKLLASRLEARYA